MTEHSPLPWAQNPSDPTMVTADFDEFGKGLNVAEAWQSEADAAFIVHCVNLHDELVAALEWQTQGIYSALVDLESLRRPIPAGPPFLDSAISILGNALDGTRAVLAKAKGEAS